MAHPPASPPYVPGGSYDLSETTKTKNLQNWEAINRKMWNTIDIRQFQYSGNMHEHIVNKLHPADPLVHGKEVVGSTRWTPYKAYGARSSGREIMSMKQKRHGVSSEINTDPDTGKPKSVTFTHYTQKQGAEPKEKKTKEYPIKHSTRRDTHGASEKDDDPDRI
jgi:hypothetical protein